MTLPTPSEVVEFGQIPAAYFPMCADEADIEAWLQARIDDAYAVLQHRSPRIAAASDPPLERVARLVVIHLTLASVFQLVSQVMNANDPPGLAPELTDAGRALEHRDFHLRQAEVLLASAPDVRDNPAVAAPVFATVGLDQDAVRTSSLVERWRDTGTRPE